MDSTEGLVEDENGISTGTFAKIKGKARYD